MALNLIVNGTRGTERPPRTRFPHLISLEGSNRRLSPVPQSAQRSRLICGADDGFGSFITQHAFSMAGWHGNGPR